MTVLPWGETPEEALASWAESDGMVPFATWLASEATPDDWHKVATSWNWDRDEDPLWWIVTRPGCDKATALLVFWRAQPEYFLEFKGNRDAVPGINQGGFDLLREIRGRWARGFYTRSELAFDLKVDCWPLDFEALEREAGEQVAIDMPPDMRGPLPGRRVSIDDMIEGTPAIFWNDDGDDDE